VLPDPVSVPPSMSAARASRLATAGLFLGLTLSLLLGCGGGSPGEGSGANAGGGQAASPSQAVSLYVERVFHEHYLWSAKLPPAGAEAYPSPEAMVRDLVARGGGERDPWTCLKRTAGGQTWTLSAAEAGQDRTFAPGDPVSAAGEPAARPIQPMEVLDFGFQIAGRQAAPGQAGVFITRVRPGSSAAQSGLRRGDRILDAGSALAGVADPGARFQTLWAMACRNWIVSAGPPPGEGTRMGFRIQPAGGGPVRDLDLARTRHDAAPVPAGPAPILAAGAHRVGYLAYHGFIRGSEPRLRERMAQFRREGVTDLILDLRYNLGGDLETTQVLANLLCARGAAGTVMFRQVGNGRRPDQVTHFEPEAEAPYPMKLACIVSEQSASASEALINALLPGYQGNLAMVGRRTGGKPVVCSHFPIPGTDLTLVLVSARVLNAQGQGDYWEGLPYAGFAGATCAAPDQLGHPQGDPREASTRAALDWIETGAAALGPVR